MSPLILYSFHLVQLTVFLPRLEVMNLFVAETRDDDPRIRGGADNTEGEDPLSE